MQTTTETRTTKKTKGATAAPPAKKNPKQPGRWKEALCVKLTVDERAIKGDVAAKLDAEVEALEADKKSAMASYKGRVDAKKSELRDTMRSIRTGEEFRQIEVYETFDYRTNTCTVMRTDTGAVLRTRALTLDERQEDLFNGATKDGKQQSLATIGDAVAAKAAKANGKANGHARAKKTDDGPTDITDPAAVLEGAVPDEPTGKRRPAKRRGR